MMAAEERQHEPQPGPVWCGACGIPYGPDTTHCAHCGRPLAAVSARAGAGGAPPAPGPPLAGPAAVPAPAVGPGLPGTTGGAPAASAGSSRRGKRRAAPMTDAEIEATAAALVARALAQSRAAGTEPAAGGPHADPPPIEAWPDAPSLARRDESPPPAFQMARKDRLWLIAGIALCVIMIVLAVAFSRLLAASAV